MALSLLCFGHLPGRQRLPHPPESPGLRVGDERLEKSSDTVASCVPYFGEHGAPVRGKLRSSRVLCTTASSAKRNASLKRRGCRAPCCFTRQSTAFTPGVTATERNERRPYSPGSDSSTLPLPPVVTGFFVRGRVGPRDGRPVDGAARFSWYAFGHRLSQIRISGA